MNDQEVHLHIVAHIISEKKKDCGCTESVTARVVLRDSEGYDRAVLAVGDPQRDTDKAIENAIRKYERSAKGVST